MYVNSSGRTEEILDAENQTKVDMLASKVSRLNSVIIKPWHVLH